jgi:hypothetical protein
MRAAAERSDTDTVSEQIQYLGLGSHSVRAAAERCGRTVLF